MVSGTDGTRDAERTIGQLARHLPPTLSALASIAYNYWWAWQPWVESLFERISPERWSRCGMNPVRLLQEAGHEELERLANDREFEAVVARADRELRTYLRERPGTTAPIAYMCAEFGIHRSLPFYAGGLGVLAGDLLKAASDQGLAMVGVGLFYREGSFHQHIDASGWQHEYWQSTDSDRLPAVLVTNDGRPLTVHVSIHGRDVEVRVWRVDAGISRLYLLDTESAANAPSDRWITSRLYVGNREVRIAQYAVLGIGGVRALRAMGIAPCLVHLNEGHAALAAVELLRERLRDGSSWEEAAAHVRSRVAFTTHTPVAAGNETYSATEVRSVLPDLPEQLGAGWDALEALGRTDQFDEAEPLGLTPLALRLSGTANAVSRRHGEVARAMWRNIRPEAPGAAESISYVTNAVHLPTWIAVEWQDLFDRYVPGWRTAALGSEVWGMIGRLPDAEIWAVRNALRTRLAREVRSRSVSERLGRGEGVRYAESAAEGWRDDVLTLGFARRIATYKRLYLITSRPDQAARLLGGNPGLQIVIAGRAHPQDEPAKATVQQLFRLNQVPGVGGRGVFLEEYDLDLARRLVQGCDLWVNLPRPPREASGTSGMKSVVNGGLQISTLDGWWAEAYRPGLGWAVGGAEEHAPDEEEDRRDTESFFALLENEILPAFYDRDAAGLPSRWIAMIRASMQELLPTFSATRMIMDYRDLIYGPTLNKGAAM